MIVLVLVAMGASSGPTGQALASSARDAFGAGTTIEVEEMSDVDLASETAADAEAKRRHADAVVVVRWSEAPPTAHVRILDEHGTGRWETRDVVFADRDPPAERGRAVGFGLAAMVPRTEELPDGLDHPPTTLPTRKTLAVDALGTAVTGTLGGFGFEVAGRYDPYSDLGFRLGAGMAFGSEGAADASFFDLRFVGGAAITFARVKPFAFAVRADAGVMRFSLRRSSINGSGARWAPTFDAMLEPTWDLAPAVAIVLAIGAETEAGRTDIVVDDALVARTPVVRASGSIGVRVRF